LVNSTCSLPYSTQVKPMAPLKTGVLAELC